MHCQAMIKMVDVDGKGNDRYFLSASKKRMSPAVKKLAAVAALATYPIEGMSLQLLEDDRFLLTAKSLWEEARSEVEWLGGLPDCVFEGLAVVVGAPDWWAAAVRSDVLLASHTSMTYMMKEADTPLAEYPLCATQGNIVDNVKRIARSEPPPKGLLGEEVHFCCRFFPEETAKALELLKQAPCSTGLLEKGHSAGAFVRRAHRLVGSAHLELRAFLSESRALLRAKRLDSERFAQQFEECLSKAAGRVQHSARNAYCSLAISASTARAAADSDRGLGQRLSKRCISSHNESFDRLPVDSQAALENLVSQVRLRRSTARMEDIKHAHAALALELRGSRSMGESGCLRVAPPLHGPPLPHRLSFGRWDFRTEGSDGLPELRAVDLLFRIAPGLTYQCTCRHCFREVPRENVSFGGAIVSGRRDGSSWGGVYFKAGRTRSTTSVSPAGMPLGWTSGWLRGMRTIAPFEIALRCLRLPMQLSRRTSRIVPRGLSRCLLRCPGGLQPCARIGRLSMASASPLCSTRSPCLATQSRPESSW